MNHICFNSNALHCEFIGQFA
ncbi:hypothetical protein KL86PLE_70134 [uncultured Pleomorphomonas sp.]|uniref:Uncharacterized protein n=1 Tax=uncultured Pleomorphomonas sp. TaxID=442121 RepID=A0A212LLI6_9HYPH|nr:hypothetical protein KL86PLE_70134 [uncultured Pleomorphomonas sp.]